MRFFADKYNERKNSSSRIYQERENLMAAFNLKTEKIKFFVGSQADVQKVEKFSTERLDEKPQDVDKVSGLPLWKIQVELIDEALGEVTQITLRIAASEKPMLQPRADYTVVGDLRVVPYIKNGTSRIDFSYTLVGSLKRAGAAPSIKE